MAPTYTSNVVNDALALVASDSSVLDVSLSDCRTCHCAEESIVFAFRWEGCGIPSARACPFYVWRIASWPHRVARKESKRMKRNTKGYTACHIQPVSLGHSSLAHAASSALFACIVLSRDFGRGAVKHKGVLR